MYTWDVTQMMLRKEQVSSKRGDDVYFSDIANVSREDKIEFLDRMNEGKISYLLDLVEKFRIAEPKMARGSFGDVRTQSLVAWLKKNDTRNLIDRHYHHGQVSVLRSERWFQHFLEVSGSWDRYEDFVDEIFFRQLKICLAEEDKYFREHDEFEIAKSKVRTYSEKYNTTFGVKIAFVSDGRILLVGEGRKLLDGPEITLDQCRILITQYEKIDRYVDQLTSECKILLP